MEEWQKQPIKNNLTELAKETSCSVQFIDMLATRNAMEPTHVKNLKSPGLTPAEKSKILYELLTKTPGSFNVLIESLQETKQTKALKILLDCSTIFPNNEAIDYDKDNVLRQTSFTGDEIYKGRFHRRYVAVKVMTADIAEAWLTLREVEMLKNLDEHENIIRYFTEEAREGSIHIALELFKNTLQDEVNSTVVNVNAIRILNECTIGVAYLHSMNVIHTDLNPTNVLLKENGQVKLCNFGLAEQTSSGKDSVTVKFENVRDRDWMAPELLVEASVASDVFSLGCIFFFVLEKGVHPFGNPGERKSNIYYGRHKLQNSALDTNWLQLIGRMISHASSERPLAKQVLLERCFTTEKSTCSSSDSSGVQPSPNLGVSMSLPTLLAPDFKSTNNTGSPPVLEKMEEIPEAPIVFKRLLSSEPSGPIPCSRSTAKKRNISTPIHIPCSNGTANKRQRISMGTQTEESQVDQQGNNKIFRAVLQGKELHELMQIVDSGSDVKRVNNAGESILHLAIHHRDPVVLKFLISAGADVSTMDKAGDLPIHKLKNTEHWFRKKLMVLCENGADINARDADGNTILGLAASTGRVKEDVELIMALSESKKSKWKTKNGNDQTILHLAVVGGNPELIKLLIKAGIKIDVKGGNGSAPIHEIAFTKWNFKETLDELLANCARINAKDNTGNTVLAWAAIAGRSKADLEYIISKGGDWKAINEKRQSILHAAAEGGNSEAIKYLIKLGLDVKLKDMFEEVPLHQLAQTKKDFKKSLDVLVENGAKVNERNKCGNRLLNLSAFCGRPKLDLEYIVAKGGDCKLTNNAGKCVLHSATIGGNIEAIKYFISLGVSIKSKDKKGQLPLHNLVYNMRNFKETLNVLLENEADINAIDKDGNTLYDLAVTKKEKEDWKYNQSILFSSLNSIQSIQYIVSKGGRTGHKINTNRVG